MVLGGIGDAGAGVRSKFSSQRKRDHSLIILIGCEFSLIGSLWIPGAARRRLIKQLRDNSGVARCLHALDRLNMGGSAGNGPGRTLHDISW